MRSSHNCILCITAPILLFASLVGNSSFYFKCSHSEKYDCIEFCFSKKKMLIPLFMALCVLYVVIENIITLAHIFYADPVPLVIARVSIDTLLCLMTGTVTIICTLQSRIRMQEYEGFSTIIRSSKMYGIDTVITKSKFHQLRAKSLYIFGLLSFSILGMIIYLIIEAATSKLSLTVLKRAAIFNGIFTFMTVTSIYDIEVSIYKEFMNRCFLEMKNILKRRLHKSELGVCNETVIVNLNTASISIQNSFESELKILKKYYWVISSNLHTFQKFMNPGMVVVLAFTTVIMVLILYVVVTLIYYDSFVIGYEYAGLILIVDFIGVTIIYCLSVFENLKKPGEDIQSFLFRYPISKLTPAEAAQVEMLITTLNIQKPVLKASDIFTVGTRLIASITGTVVTYVLVALQFQAAWAKQ